MDDNNSPNDRPNQISADSTVKAEDILMQSVSPPPGNINRSPSSVYALSPPQVALPSNPGALLPPSTSYPSGGSAHSLIAMVGGGATARRGSTQSAFDNTTQQQQQQQLLLLSSSSPQPSSRGSRIIRSAAILPGESDITGQESEDNLPVVKRASIRRLEDSGPQITVPTDRKNSRHSMGQDNVKSIDLIASPAAKQSSNVVTTATAEESSDDEYDEDDSGADESIPESEEFVIDSAAISRSLMDNLNSEPDGESDADDGASASDSPSSDSPSSSEDEYDSILHPSKHRTDYPGKKKADVATQTKLENFSGQDQPHLQLPSFQATPMDFIAAVEDDYEYLVALPASDTADRESLMKPISKSSINNQIMTPVKSEATATGSNQKPKQRQQQLPSSAQKHHQMAQIGAPVALTAKQADKNRSQNLLGSMALEKRIHRIEIQNKRAKMGRISRAFYDFSKWLTIKQNYIARASGLWASHLRFIESRFGTGIVSYFSLYRWNFVLNLFLGLLWLVFVILFGILDMFRNNNEGWLKFWNGPYLNQTMDAGTFAQQLFSGQGSIERSFFLYGNYKSRYDNYQLDLAYMGLIFAFYIFSFVAIISRMRKLFVSRPEVSGNISVDEASPFGTVVFASWDYCISQKDTQTNHCFAVSTVLKTLITRVEISEKQKKISRRDKVYNILRRVFGNLIVLILLGSYGFLILISLASQFSSQISWLIPVTQTSAYKWTQTFPNFVSSTALLISFFNATLPLLFWGVTRFERYTDPVNEARIMLARTYLMKMSSIYIVLVGYFYTYSDEKSGKNWENEIGKTYYQLIWTNFLFTAVGTILIGFGTRVFLGKRFYDFGISDNILEVIYRQALVWVGTVYSPMAIIISLATSYLLFFIKKFVLVHCSLPPKRIYNSYTQNLYFLGFQLVTLGLMAFPVFYSITRMKPTCGPFGPEIFPAGQGKQLDYAYQLVSDSISGIRYPFFRESLTFIGSVGFILPLILLLSIWIYYLRAVSDKRQKRSKQLQYELNMERADKKFLLRYYKVKL